MRTIIFGLIMTAMSSTLFAGDMKLSGDTHFYYDFEELDTQSFHISRAYLTYENKVSDKLSYKFQTDVGSGGATDFTVYLKNAKLDWKTSAGKFTLGLQGMNMFKIQENNWGYRFIEKSAMDRKKYSSSADLGVGFDRSIGSISANLMLTNGTGYKKNEDDGYKKLSARVLYGPAKLKTGLNAGVSFSYEPADYTDGASGDTETGSTTVLGLFGGWAQGALKVGADMALLNKEMDTSTSTSLVSAYGNFKINKQLAAFGRMDVYSTDSSSDSYAILGLNYVPEKGFHIAPNVRVEMPDGSDASMTYRLNFRFKL